MLTASRPRDLCYARANTGCAAGSDSSLSSYAGARSRPDTTPLVCLPLLRRLLHSYRSYGPGGAPGAGWVHEHTPFSSAALSSRWLVFPSSCSRSSTAQTSSFRYYSSRLCVFSFAFLPRRSEPISCRSHPLLSFSLSYRGFCAPSVFPSAPHTFQRALLLCPVGESWFTCQCQERGTLSLSSPSKVCIVLLAVTNASMAPTPRPLLTSISAGTGVPAVTEEHAAGWQMGRFQ